MTKTDRCANCGGAAKEVYMFLSGHPIYTYSCLIKLAARLLKAQEAG